MDKSFALSLTLFSLVCLALQIPPLQVLVEWNRHLIQSGEWWRIVTGNLTHTNAVHFALNIASLWIICFLFRSKYFVVVGVTCVSTVTIGLGLFYSDINIYLGLSGVLHALFTFFALSEALQGRCSSWLLVFGVIVKIALEQFQGASENTAKMINADVAIEAHLIGGITGLILAILWRGYQFQRQRQR